MLRFFLAWTIALVPVLVLSPLVRAQTAPRQQAEATENQKPAPAPRHDISGIWDPGNDGIQPLGPRAMPEDGKPEHQIPYTPLGLETLNTHKPSNGTMSVLPSETNDPVVYCDPQGIPREDLYELRTTQILQTPLSVYVLYEFDRIWRVIWTDGRDLPKDPEPRWFGYSVGKWEGDEFVVTTAGINDQVWNIDLAGHPHSDALRVTERFKRVDFGHMDIQVTIDDAKTYTKPWAMPVMRYTFLPDTDLLEFVCEKNVDPQHMVGNK